MIQSNPEKPEAWEVYPQGTMLLLTRPGKAPQYTTLLISIMSQAGKT